MAISEEARHRLYLRLEEVLGPEQATTMMEHLPPVGWADVATRRDLDVLRLELEAFRTEFGLRLDSMANLLRADFHRDLRMQLFAILGANATFTALAVAAARLA